MAILLGIFEKNLFSQSPEAIQFDRITSDEGLSQNTVICMLQDRRGFMWFGTQSGLNRYDGYSMKTFHHDPSDSTSLPDDYVLKLYEGENSDLVISTILEGVFKFDRRSETFSRLSVPQAIAEKFLTVSAHDFEMDSQNRLWVCAPPAGLFVFDRNWQVLASYEPDSLDADAPGNFQITCVYEDREGRHWIGTTAGGLGRLDPGSDKFRWFRNTGRKDGSLSDNHVTEITEDASGHIWVATLGGGLNRYEEAGGTFTHFRADPADETSIQSDRIWTILIDDKGYIWIATFDAGLDRFDPRTGKFVHSTSIAGDPTSLSDNTIQSLFQDRSGVIWVGTMSGGVNRVLSQARHFQVFRASAEQPEALTHSDVVAMYTDSKNKIWVGTRNGGLNYYDPQTHSFQHFIHDINDRSSLSQNHVRAIFEDHYGEIWVGVFDQFGGVNRFDQHTGTFQRYLHQPNEPNSLAGNYVRSLNEDLGGNLWIGLTQDGVARLSADRTAFSIYSSEMESISTVSDNGIMSIYRDSTGILWLGTWNGGLNRLEPENAIFTAFTHDPEDSTSISSDRIWSVYESRSGEFWVATSNGLNRMERETGRFEQFSTEDGLCNKTVFGILEDGRARLWLSTENGLSCFDPGDGSFVNFYKADGLAASEFNHGAFAQTRNGEMYFGGIDGFTRFHPDSIETNINVPKMAITRFRIFEEDAVLDSAISEKKQINLSYEERFFSLEFAALEFTDPARNQYAYKLEGFDDEWRRSGTRRFISYSNLDPGNYRFRAKGSNSDGIWNDEGTSLLIRVLPPWYRTNWAYAIYLLLIVATILGGKWVINNWKSLLSIRARKISHFKLLERIGAGGMGEVYRALDTNTQDVCAIKLLNPDLIGDEANRKRLANEGRLLTSFSHPHIVRVFEVGELAEEGYIAMEYLSGGTLREYLAENHPLSLDDIQKVLLQICDGLGTIHSQGIIHRDLKTANIMLDENGDIRIMDFGLSKSPLVTTMTSVGTVLGTLGYVAPEQVTGSGVGMHTDIFSLGVIIFELLTNQLPFSGENEMALIHSIFNHQPEELHILRDGIGSEWQKLVNGCLEKDFQSRFQTTADVMEILRTL